MNYLSWKGNTIEFLILIIALIICLSLSGCANKKGIIEISDIVQQEIVDDSQRNAKDSEEPADSKVLKKLIEFSGTRPFKATYEELEDGRIKASFDMKGQPLLNIGQIPDVALKN